MHDIIPEELTAKEYFSILVSVILLTDLMIFLDVPFLRQIFAFLGFTIIPGVLIIHILRLNKIKFLKKFVLSVGLSVAFLMFAGLFMNQLYLSLGFPKPLSTFSLVFSFTTILIALSLIAYNRNKDDFRLSDVFNVELNLKRHQNISPVLFPILFPFLAIFGTWLMNTEGNNIILMIMLFLIPLYVAIIVYQRKKNPEITYPIAIWMISLALLLMSGLTSNYLTGRDVHTEYYAFRVVESNLYWSMSNYPHVLTACLSTSLLPTVYKSLLAMDGLYVYKLLYNLIFSVVPLCLYLLFTRYIGNLYAFLASVFFMAQMPFIYLIQSAMRQEIAYLGFALAMLVFFDDEIDKLNKRILILIFIFAVVLSHYTTAYIFFILLFLVGVLNTTAKSKPKNKVTAIMIALFFAVIFFWYSQVTTASFNNLVRFGRNTFMNLGSFFIAESRAEGTLMLIGKEIFRFSDMINVFIHEVSFVFITIGVFSLVRTYVKKDKSTKFDRDVYLMIIMSYGLAAAAIILPYVSKGYGMDRIYLQALIFLSPAFVLGGEAVANFISRFNPKLNLSLLIIVVVLVAQFFSGSYLVYQIGGVPHSATLNRQGMHHDEMYIYDQEVIAAEWLNDYGSNDLKTYSDYFAGTRLALGYDINKKPKVISSFFKNNRTVKNGYIFLRHTSVVDGIVYIDYEYHHVKNIKDYSHLFVGKYKIYGNGCAAVYK